MSSFHINPKTGNPGSCSASAGNCPFGDTEHFSSKEEARGAYEAAMDSFSSAFTKSDERKVTEAAEKVLAIRRDDELDGHLQNVAFALNEASQAEADEEVDEFTDSSESWRDDAYESLQDAAGVIQGWTGAAPKAKATGDGWKKAGAGKLSREDGSYMERDSGTGAWYFKRPNGETVNHYPGAPQKTPLFASSSKILLAQVQKFERTYGPIKAEGWVEPTEYREDPIISAQAKPADQ